MEDLCQFSILKEKADQEAHNVCMSIHCDVGCMFEVNDVRSGLWV